ncbi:MAG: hypothetical protein IPL53_03360 [Ignavibacteria bacterium]|nr:hypothetical protein [Ignavibacteria bacterium]
MGQGSKRFNGNLWVNIGSVKGIFTNEQSLAMSGITPYVAFIEVGNGLQVTKFEDGNWIYISPNLDNVSWPCLVVNNGIPYVSFNSGESVSVINLDYPLPVELNAFASQVVGRNVNLTWSTSSETNNSGFDIERKSVNGTWAKSGLVAGHGIITVQENYTFTDRNLASGVYNYRLRQIDLNGELKYFNLNNEVSVGIPSKFKVYQNYPNPFNSFYKDKFRSAFDSKVKISVFDISGKG